MPRPRWYVMSDDAHVTCRVCGGRHSHAARLCVCGCVASRTLYRRVGTSAMMYARRKANRERHCVIWSGNTGESSAGCGGVFVLPPFALTRVCATPSEPRRVWCWKRRR